MGFRTHSVRMWTKAHMDRSRLSEEMKMQIESRILCPIPFFGTAL